MTFNTVTFSSFLLCPLRMTRWSLFLQTLSLLHHFLGLYSVVIVLPRLSTYVHERSLVCCGRPRRVTCPPRTGPGVMLVLGLKERGVKMARRKHTAEQIINKLREAEVAISAGSTVAEVSRQIGVTQQTQVDPIIRTAVRLK